MGSHCVQPQHDKRKCYTSCLRQLGDKKGTKKHTKGHCKKLCEQPHKVAADKKQGINGTTATPTILVVP